MSRLVSALQNLALMGFGLLLALAILEVGFRIAGVGGPGGLGPVFDRPPIDYRPQAARLNPWTTGVDDPYRVAFVGDSFTAGEANQIVDSFPWRMQRLLNLNEVARPVEVNVIARPGTSTTTQRQFVREALDWGADLVVLGIFLNDTEFHADRNRHEWSERIRARVPEGWKREVLRGSRALEWLYMRYERSRATREYLRYYEYLWDPDYEGFRRFKEAIAMMTRSCRREGVEFVAIILPGLGRLGDDYSKGWIHERIAGVLEDNDVRYLDLLPAFLDKSEMRLNAYPGVDGHPNEIGHRIIAHHLFRWLLDAGILDASYEPVNKVARGYQRRTWRKKTQILLHPVWYEERGKKPDPQ